MKKKKSKVSFRPLLLLYLAAMLVAVVSFMAVDAYAATRASDPLAAGRRSNRPQTRIGRVLLTGAEDHAVCLAGLNRTPYNSNARESPNTTPISRQAYEVLNGGARLLPTHLVVLPCARPLSLGAANNNPGPTTLVAFNLLSHRVVWALPILSTADGSTTLDQHVFIFSHRRTSPSGFQSGNTRYFVTAYSTASGRKVWTAAAPESLKESLVTEGPSPRPGSRSEVVFTHSNGITAYDSQTGRKLWTTARRTYLRAEVLGSYVGYGIVEVYGYQDNKYDDHTTGFDARTGKQVWDVHFPIPCSSSSMHRVLVGSIEWTFGDGCVEAHDLLTGDVKLDLDYPSSWQGVAASPTTASVYTAGHFSLYKWPDVAHAIWSIAAGTTTPVITMPGHLLVKAPSGMLIVDAKNGSIVAHTPEWPDDPVRWTNGLLQATGTAPYQPGLGYRTGDTSIFDLDFP